MIFPYADGDGVEPEITEETGSVPKEYEIDFKTGQLTGRKVEGSEAVKAWAWLALQTARYRYPAYSWDYGQEYDDLVGQSYSRGYIEMELERMTEECLLVNPDITGIEDFSVEFTGSTAHISFKLLTKYGDEEVDADV